MIKNQTRTREGMLAVAIIIVALLAYAFWPRPIPVEVARISRGSLKVTVDEEGRTRIKERYIISSPCPGQLLRVQVHAGDAVERGATLLASLDPTEPRLLDPRERAESAARVKSAEASRERTIALLDRARAAHDFAKTELERIRNLHAAGTVPVRDVEVAEERERTGSEELKAAKSAVQIAEFELELARAAFLRISQESPGELDNWQLHIRSPIDGRVLRVFQESATVVAPGNRLLEIGDSSQLEIEVDVLSADAVNIRPGADVIVDRWGGEYPLQGRVRVVEPAGFTKISALGIEEQRVWVIADFIDSPQKWNRLGDGFRVEARIVIWEGHNVLLVPTGALIRRGDAWAVFVIDDGKARLRVVKIGRMSNLQAEVAAGLSEGDTVIIHPSDKVEDQKRVRPRFETDGANER